MDILVTPPLRATAFVFYAREGAPSLAVVCKLTFLLTQGVATLAPEQEEIHEEEQHWDDDPRKSLYAPSDVAPLKMRPEVLIVGSAFAPGGRPVRTLLVRAIVGDMDKAIEVSGPRLFSASGELRGGAAWSKMPLRYERATGGPDTWNPVGVPMDGPRDPYGQKHLPNMQPAGIALRDPSQLIPAIGFGPIASSWPSRYALLRGRMDFVAPRSAKSFPLGDDFDNAYFQDAPFDQQLSSLSADEAIVLEHLHPEHERLITKLPGLRPRVTVETRVAGASAIAVTPDTLWIDTDKARCTLTFRGQKAISTADSVLRVRLSLDEAETRSATPGARLGVPRPGQRPLVLSSPVEAIVDEPITDVHQGLPSALAAVKEPIPDDLRSETTATARPMQTKALPFAVGPKESASAAHAESSPARPATSPKNPHLQGRSATQEFVMPASALAGPAWFAPVAPPPSLAAASASALLSPPPGVPVPPGPGVPVPPGPGVPVPPGPGMPFVPAAPIPPAGSGLSPPPPAKVSTLPGLAASAPAMATVAAPPGVAQQAFTPIATPAQLSTMSASALLSPPPGSAPPRGTTTEPTSTVESAPAEEGDLRTVSVLSASNAAAFTSPRRDTSRASSKHGEPSADGKSAEPSYLELLWLDKAVVPALRSHPVFSSWMKPPPKPATAEKGKPPPPPPSPEAVEKAEKGDVIHILGKDPQAAKGGGPPQESAEDTEPPLALLQGTLAFPFEPIPALKATIAVAKPLANVDKKLKEIIDLSGEMLKGDFEIADAAEGLSAKIREAWSRANRSHPAGYLDARVEAKLLEQRAYQKRSLLDGDWIRALLVSVQNETFVAYLPVAIEKRLPLFARFSVKLLAEVYPQQDAEETAPEALKVVAIARVAPRPKVGR